AAEHGARRPHTMNSTLPARGVEQRGGVSLFAVRGSDPPRRQPAQAPDHGRSRSSRGGRREGYHAGRQLPHADARTLQDRRLRGAAPTGSENNHSWLVAAASHGLGGVYDPPAAGSKTFGGIMRWFGFFAMLATLGGSADDASISPAVAP